MPFPEIRTPFAEGDTGKKRCDFHVRINGKIVAGICCIPVSGMKKRKKEQRNRLKAVPLYGCSDTEN